MNWPKLDRVVLFCMSVVVVRCGGMFGQSFLELGNQQHVITVPMESGPQTATGASWSSEVQIQCTAALDQLDAQPNSSSGDGGLSGEVEVKEVQEEAARGQNLNVKGLIRTFKGLIRPLKALFWLEKALFWLERP